jgi:hypothetical protein
MAIAAAPGERFSVLKPIEPSLGVQLAIDICNFFHPMNSRKNRELLGLGPSPTITPFSVFQFFEWADKERKHLIDYWRYKT